MIARVQIGRARLRPSRFRGTGYQPVIRVPSGNPPRLARRLALPSVVTLAAALIALTNVGCVTVEGGFKYEYQGRVLRADGKTPAKNVSVRMARSDPAATQPVVVDLTDKASKAALKYQDRYVKRKTDSTGTYVGILETFHGWKYSEVFGNHIGPTHPPLPPPLDEVILYVDEKGSKPVGYRMKVPAENQATATSGVRKIHLPDLILPPRPTTKPTTQPTTQP